jgi:hypothetical protein
MKSDPKLEPILVWDDAGHLAETAVTALVDGEVALLPEQAVRHAGACALCAERVGIAAMLALEIADALEARAELGLARADEPVAAAIPVRRPLPLGALAAALAVAVVGILPSLRALPTLAVRLPSIVVHGLPVYMHAVAIALGQAHRRGVFFEVWATAVVLLVVAGLSVARLAPRPLTYKGAS